MSDLPRIDTALSDAVQNWPDNIAFRCRGEALTYSELWRRAKGLATSLQIEGVEPGDRVAIGMTKGLEMPVAIHAIWMVGAAFVPLDPTAPIERLAGIIRDCEIGIVIGSSRDRSFLGKLVAVEPLTIIGADVEGARSVLPPSDADSFEPCENAPDDLAYIIFTSGSTGVPKGICHSFASGSAFAHAWITQYGLAEDDVFFCTVPLHFDFSLADFFTPPMAAAMTELVPEPVLMFPASLGELLEQSGGTIWSSVPYTFIQLCERGAVDQRDFSKLRWLIYGGEPMPPSALPNLRQVFQAKISNSYGPAEVNQVSEYTVPADHPADLPIPIGCTMCHSEFMREDDGELLVAAGSMMSGYWNRPELNDKIFVEIDGTRFYRTCDRVSEDGMGLWVFMGRSDRQVKIRGYRIELDEVEMALASHDAVAEAAAIVGQDGATLQGFVTLLPDCEVSEAGLQAHVGQTLPRYAVPDRIDIRQSFAKTSTGKINRRALIEETV